MELLTTFTLFGSIIGFYLFIFAFILLLIISDLAENGTSATIIFIVFFVIGYMWGSFPILEIFTLANVGIYLIIGFIFSLIRTYFKGKELDEENKKYFDLKSSVFRWWFLFPISMINWIFGSLLKDAYNWLYSKFSKVFEYVFNL